MNGTALTDNDRRLILIAAWILAAIAILPAILHWKASAPATGSARVALMAAEYLVAAAICWGIYRVESRRLAPRAAFLLVFLVFLLTSATNNVHAYFIDYSSQLFIKISNHTWQSGLQDNVIDLSPGALPHSYRFLPNSIVRWIELAGLDYDDARDAFRLIFGLLVYYSIYRYARLYCNFIGALLAMLFVAAIYPISFEHYAGQLTDPISHLSFVLAFIFLETDEFALLLTTLLIGSLAKETVLAMAGYYVIAGYSNWRENKFILKTVGLCAAVVAAYVGTRMFVLHGAMNYSQVSGVTFEQVRTNWEEPQRWVPPFLLTACALMPFLIAAWKETPISLKRLPFFLLPVLFTSGLLFSWLRESRNFMPLVVVLAVAAGRYLSTAFAETAEDPLLGPQPLKKRRS